MAAYLVCQRRGFVRGKFRWIDLPVLGSRSRSLGFLSHFYFLFSTSSCPCDDDAVKTLPLLIDDLSIDEKRRVFPLSG